MARLTKSQIVIAGLLVAALFAALLLFLTNRHSGLPVTVSSSVKNRPIVDALYEEPNTLNPVIGPPSFYAEIVEATMFPNLFVTLPNGKVIPELASVVPTVANGGISSNGLIYVFHLRRGVKWSDGAPFTAMDVWETYHVIMSPKVNAITTAGFSDIKTFQIVNKYEVRITLYKPYTPFITTDWTNTQPGIIPYHIFKKIPLQDVNTASFNSHPTATLGPYEFVSWIPGTAITVKANPYWWGPPVKTKSIVFKIMPNESSILLAAKAHEINVDFFAPPEEYAQLKSIPGSDVVLAPFPDWEAIVLNWRNPLLRNRVVRVALAMALNRAAVAKAVWHGGATVLAADQPPESWAYDRTLRPYPYNPQQALKLLKGQGFTLRDGTLYTPSGKPFTLVFATTAGDPYRQFAQTIWQSDLAQIGIHLIVHDYPASTLFSSAVWQSGKVGGQPGGWDMLELAQVNVYDPTVLTQQSFESNDGFYSGYHSAYLDTLIADESSLVTQSQRKPIFNRIESYLHYQEPWIFLFSWPMVDAAFGMSGYQPNPWYVDSWNAYAWSLNR